MRTIIIVILICVSVILSTSLAHAQNRSFGGATLDIPFAYRIEQDDLSVSGYIAGVSYKFLGIAIEKYTLRKFDEFPGLKANVTMLDVFAEIPIFILDIGLGVGYGRATFDSPGNSQHPDAALGQIFFRIGLGDKVNWIGVKYLAIHIGFHSVSGVGKERNNSQYVDLHGNMTTIGVMVFFPLG